MMIKSTKLPHLPWFIWKEIINYSVPQKTHDLCFINKFWFIQVINRYNNVKGLGSNVNYYDSLPWYDQQVETLYIRGFTEINWDYISRFRYIKKVELLFDSHSDKIDLEGFDDKLIQMLNLVSLEVRLTNICYEKLNRLSFLNYVNFQLKELKINFFVNEFIRDLDTAIDDIYFPNLVFLSFSYEANKFSISKILTRMPKIKKLHITLYKTRHDDIPIVIGYPMPQFKILSVYTKDKNESKILCKIDLSKFPNLKKLQLNSDTEFINSKKDQFSTEIEKLTLFNNPFYLSENLVTDFPKLKYLHLDCFNLESNQVYNVLKISGHLKRLKLDLDYSSFPSTFPTVSPSLTKLTICGEAYLTDDFINWLAHHTTLRYLTLTSFGGDRPLSYKDLSLNDLEELCIQTGSGYSAIKSIFQPTKYPKLVRWWIRDIKTNDEIRNEPF